MLWVHQCTPSLGTLIPRCSIDTKWGVGDGVQACRRVGLQSIKISIVIELFVWVFWFLFL